MATERISYSVVSGNNLRGYNFSRQGIVSLADELPDALKHVVVRSVKCASGTQHDLIAAFPNFASAWRFAETQNADVKLLAAVR